MIRYCVTIVLAVVILVQAVEIRAVRQERDRERDFARDELFRLKEVARQRGGAWYHHRWHPVPDSTTELGLSQLPIYRFVRERNSGRESFEFFLPNGKRLVLITRDRIVFANGYTPDSETAALWRALQESCIAHSPLGPSI